MDPWPDFGRRVFKPIREWRKDIRRRARRMRLLPGSASCSHRPSAHSEPGPYRTTHWGAGVSSAAEAIATGPHSAAPPAHGHLKRKHSDQEQGRLLVPNHEQPNGDCPWCGPICKVESAFPGTSLPRNIMMAVAEKNPDQLALLLKERFRHPKFSSAIEQRWQHQLHNALQIAVVLQSRDMAAMLLEAGKTLRTTSSLRMHLLTAVEAGNDAIVTLLLQYGADPNARGFDEAPAHVAARNGHIGILNLLYKAGADLCILSAHHHSTPLHCAAARGQTDTFKYLLSKSTSLECRDKAGRTPLHLAAKSKNSFTVFELLCLGACKTAQDQDGKQPWMYAVANDDVMTMEMLLSDDESRKEREIRDAIIMAVRNSHMACLAAMLKKPPLVHQDPILDDQCASLLMIAFDTGNIAAAKTVLDNAPNNQLAINAKDSEGLCVLSYAMTCLESRNDSEEPLVKKLLHQLIQAGADPNLSYINGKPLLFSHDVMVSVERLRFLIGCGCHVNVVCDDGYTVWHAAIYDNGHETNVARALQCLVNANADIRLTSVKLQNGFTPLIYALISERFLVARSLLKHGCSTSGLRAWTKDNPSAAICTEENLADLREHMDWAARRPRTLREACRLEILSSVGQCNDLEVRIGRLGLPKTLQRFVTNHQSEELLGHL